MPDLQFRHWTLDVRHQALLIFEINYIFHSFEIFSYRPTVPVSLLSANPLSLCHPWLFLLFSLMSEVYSLTV